MRIFNESKNYELIEFDFDYNKGYLKNDKLFIAHHNAVSYSPPKTVQELVEEYREQGKTVKTYEEQPNKYYLVLRSYDSGGEDVEEIEPTAAIEAREAYDEYEDIQVYVPYTDGELEERRLTALRSRRKQLLAAFDKYKSNVDYGIERETQTQHEDMLAWYEDLLGLKEYAFEHVPERIKYYFEKSLKPLDK